MTRSARSSRGVVLMGSQEPTARIVPAYQSSDGLDAEKLLRVGGMVLDEWQASVLDDWMGRTASGRWAASTCGGSVPRQNGKTLLLQARMCAGMLLLGETVIYTAHLQKTATETFEEMRDFFDAPKIKPYVADIKNALGREQIILKSGARVKFLARTRNGGRGQHGDLLIIDEAQEIDETQQASFLPSISASLNPQTIYTGTPPDNPAIGHVFRGVRDKAKESSSTAWFEFSVPEIGDVYDRRRWAATNPALGIRIMESTVEGECEQMATDVFARERLGWWSPVVSERVEKAIDGDVWAACVSDELKPDGKTAYGVKFSADGSEVCLCGAVCPKEGAARITLINRQPTGNGIKWLADWLNERSTKASCVVVDGRNGSDVLVERLQEVWRVKGSVIRPSSRDVVAAVGTLTTELSERSVTWYRGQEVLADSAVNAIKRPLAGGWAFGGDNSTPIEAAALALWGCRTSKRDPSRPMRIG